MTRLFAGTPFDIPPTCEICGELESACECSGDAKEAVEREKQRLAALLPPDEQRARVVVRSKKGHKVTVVEGLKSSANDFAGLLKQLQNACGAGGTAKPKENVIELQGDQRTSVEKRLRELGYRL